MAFNPWVGKIPWRRKWQPLRYSGLENSVDRGDWWATVQRVAKSQSLTHTHKHTHTHLTISDENVFAIIVILVYIMLSLTNSQSKDRINTLNPPAIQKKVNSVQFSHSVLSDSLTPWSAAYQTSLSIINTQSLLKLMSIESVMPSNHLILCHPLLLLPPIPPSIRVF